MKKSDGISSLGLSFLSVEKFNGGGGVSKRSVGESSIFLLDPTKGGGITSLVFSKLGRVGNS